MDPAEVVNPGPAASRAGFAEAGTQAPRIAGDPEPAPTRPGPAAHAVTAPAPGPSAALKALILRILPRPLHDEALRRHYFGVLKRFREEDEPDMAVARYLVRPGDCAVDLGANIGIYTRLLSELVGPGGEVVSIEAVPGTYAILAANVERLGLGNVRTLHCAASAEDGTAWMEVPGYRGFYRAKVAGDGEGNTGAGRRIRVEARSLDSLFAGHPRNIGFIKCDVEGHELACIRGAARLLETHSPRWLMEIGDDPDAPGSNGRLLLEEFARRGYGAYWFDGGALRRRNPGDSSVNYFLLKPGHLAEMAQTGTPFPILA